MRKLVGGDSIELGVCYYPEHWPKENWETDLQRMLSCGLKTIRIAEFAWSIVEPKEGIFDYSFFAEFLDLEIFPYKYQHWFAWREFFCFTNPFLK